MPEIKSKYYSVTIPVPTDLDDAAKTKHVFEMRTKIRNWANIRGKCKGFYENDAPLDISNPKTTYLEFYEPKLKSNLRTLQPDYFFTRLTEEEFTNRTKDLTNSIRHDIQISEHSIGISNIRIHNMKPISTIKTTSNGVDITESLCTFTIDTQKRFMKDICGMVGKISFENPDGNEVLVSVHKMLYSVTRDTFIDFTIPNVGSLTQGQLVQKVASGLSDQTTRTKFPDFCGGDVLSKYINMSRIDGLEITGLDDDASISLECYTIMKSASGIPCAPLWMTYSFSV